MKCNLYNKEGTFLGQTTIDQTPENYQGKVLQWKGSVYQPTGVEGGDDNTTLKFEEVDVHEISESDFITALELSEQSLKQDA